MGHKPRTLAATSGHSRALNPVGQQEHRSWQASFRTTALPSPCGPWRGARSGRKIGGGCCPLTPSPAWSSRSFPSRALGACSWAVQCCFEHVD